MAAERLGYQPALDGVRAVAISLVMLFHYPWKNTAFGANPVHGGFLGVDAFFVLSGFLITTLLLQEHARFGAISLRRFYTRRALRLLPALAVLLVIALILHFTLSAADHNHPRLDGLVGVVFYVANWINIYSPRALGIAGDTWSLAIEEQFYLAWPLVLILLFRRRLRPGTIAMLTAVAIAASAARRAWYWRHRLGHVNFVNYYLQITNRRIPTNVAGGDGHRFAVAQRLYFGTDTRADALLAGCLTAVLLFWLLPRMSARVRASLSAVSVVALVVAALIVSRAILVESGWMYDWGFLAFALSIAVVVGGLVAAPRSPLSLALALAPLVWIGRRSYAIYLFHPVVYLYCSRARVHLAPPLSFVFQIVVVLVVAELSYRLVEAPMLRRKRAFEAPSTEPA